jgi:hypothetical protein
MLVFIDENNVAYTEKQLKKIARKTGGCLHQGKSQPFSHMDLVILDRSFKRLEKSNIVNLKIKPADVKYITQNDIKRIEKEVLKCEPIFNSGSDFSHEIGVYRLDTRLFKILIEMSPQASKQLLIADDKSYNYLSYLEKQINTHTCVRAIYETITERLALVKNLLIDVPQQQSDFFVDQTYKNDTDHLDKLKEMHARVSRFLQMWKKNYMDYITDKIEELSKVLTTKIEMINNWLKDEKIAIKKTKHNYITSLSQKINTCLSRINNNKMLPKRKLHELEKLITWIQKNKNSKQFEINNDKFVIIKVNQDLELLKKPCEEMIKAIKSGQVMSIVNQWTDGYDDEKYLCDDVQTEEDDWLSNNKW